MNILNCISSWQFANFQWDMNTNFLSSKPTFQRFYLSSLSWLLQHDQKTLLACQQQNISEFEALAMIKLVNYIGFLFSSIERCLTVHILPVTADPSAQLYVLSNKWECSPAEYNPSRTKVHQQSHTTTKLTHRSIKYVHAHHTELYHSYTMMIDVQDFFLRQ